MADYPGPDRLGPDRQSDEAWEQLGAEPGLCRDCRHARLNQTRRGPAYLRCAHPALPRYPRLPVTGCPGCEPPPGP